MSWKWFATMAVGMLESAGIAKISEDENDTGADDIQGQGLLFAAKFLRWLISGAKGDAPKPPKAVTFASSILLFIILGCGGFVVNVNAQDCTGTTPPYYSALALGIVGTDSSLNTRIPNAAVDIQKNVGGFFSYYTTVYTDTNGNWEFTTVECGEYRAGNVDVPNSFEPCAHFANIHNILWFLQNSNYGKREFANRETSL